MPTDPTRTNLMLIPLLLGSLGLVHCAETSDPAQDAANPSFSKTAVSPLEQPSFEQEGIRIAPYLVHLGTTKAIVALRTAQAQRVAARLVPLDDSVKAFESSSPGSKGPTHQHAFAFQGLVPGTTYRFQCTGFEDFLIETLRIGADVRFAILGHTHGTEHMTHYPDELLTARIDEYRPEFVVHAGDCVYYSTPAHWQEDYFRLFQGWRRSAPVYISPGNHDAGWPFLDGYDLRLFREMFPHSYPEEVGTGPGEAFYHVRQGPIDFYFLSYVADMTLAGTQVPWLNRELARSTAAFRVVVFGGMNPYFAKQQFWEDVDQSRIDLVINGDGAAPKEIFQPAATPPRLILGTHSSLPHPWVAAHGSADQLSLKVLDAQGKSMASHWLHPKKKHPSVQVLTPYKTERRGNKTIWTARVEPALASTDFDGLQVQIEGRFKGTGTAFISIQPQQRLGNGEFGYRSQYYNFTENDRLITFSSTHLRPLRSEPFMASRVQIAVVNSAENGPAPSAIWLFQREREGQ